MDARTLDDGRGALGRLGDDRRPAIALSPSFWSNALITALILIGPAIEDSASGKSVLEGTAMRTCLFVGVALYAWGTILLLERWRPARLPAVRPKPASEERPA